MTPQTDKQLNCVRMFCPMPVIKTKIELEKLQVGQILEIIADDPAAELDLPSLASCCGRKNRQRHPRIHQENQMNQTNLKSSADKLSL